MLQMDFMMGDPSMMGPSLEVDGKEILHFKGFILVPPPPNAPPRTTREKPPGCKTLFVGGLPETVTEDMIGELMQTCGSKTILVPSPSSPSVLFSPSIHFTLYVLSIYLCVFTDSKYDLRVLKFCALVKFCV